MGTLIAFPGQEKHVERRTARNEKLFEAFLDTVVCPGLDQFNDLLNSDDPEDFLLRVEQLTQVLASWSATAPTS